MDQTLDYLVCWKAKFNILENPSTFITFLFPLTYPKTVSPQVCYTFYLENLSTLLHLVWEFWKALVSSKGRYILPPFKMEAGLLYRTVTSDTWVQKHHSRITVHRSLFICKPIPPGLLWPWVPGACFAFTEQYTFSLMPASLLLCMGCLCLKSLMLIFQTRLFMFTH